MGRKDEYEEARSLWREVADGTGQTLLISGEPGIGKTRLMREVVTQSEVSGGRALVGEASAESNTPYGAFAQMVRRALDQQSKNSVELPDFVLDDVLVLAPDLRPYYPDIESDSKLACSRTWSHSAAHLANNRRYFSCLMTPIGQTAARSQCSSILLVELRIIPSCC